MIAHAVGAHDTVGIDLVAMNVNDLVVQGAEPLFFLDCYSCGKLDVATAAAFVRGVADGCVQAGCALIGGETAEMPGLFASDSDDAGTYDAVGAAIGAINTAGPHARSLLPLTDAMREGDVLLALASSGPHSNGYSLIRKIVDRSGLKYSDPAPFAPNQTLGTALLTPTRIYTKPLLQALSSSSGSGIKGLAHITGGGLPENIPRMLPSTLTASIDARSWPLPPVFTWLKKTGAVEATEMARAFNCGVGMVLVVDREAEGAVREVLERQGETVFRVGELRRKNEGGDGGCVLGGLESWDV